MICDPGVCTYDAYIYDPGRPSMQECRMRISVIHKCIYDTAEILSLTNQ